MKPLMIAAAALLFTTAVFADEDPKPLNGGRAVHAGPWHVELVAKDKMVDVYLADHDNKPVAAAGVKGLAILVAGGKSQRITLTPVDGSRLTGTSEVSLASDVKGAVQLTGPNGKSATARFQ